MLASLRIRNSSGVIIRLASGGREYAASLRLSSMPLTTPTSSSTPLITRCFHSSRSSPQGVAAPSSPSSSGPIVLPPSYLAARRHALEDPASFWHEQAGRVSWAQPYTRVLDNLTDPYASWFKGGYLNGCYNAVDRHVETGRGDQAAIIFHSAITGRVSTLSYNELLKEVKKAAAVLLSHGVGLGDRVLIYMLTLSEAIVTMLACGRIGAVHSVVFGGFAAPELRARIDDASPKVVVAASYGLEGANKAVPFVAPLAEAIEISKHKPETVILLVREETIASPSLDAQVKLANEAATRQLAVSSQSSTSSSSSSSATRWFSWKEEMEAASKSSSDVPCVWVPSEHPSYILYTSGSTGAPKGVVRDTGGHAVALSYAMEAIYGMQPGEVWFAASDVGWVVGHSFTTYGPLFTGMTTVLFEGKPVGTPDPATYSRIIEKHRVKAMFTAPTALRAMKREDSDGSHFRKYDTSSLTALFVAGERCDPDTFAWATSLLNGRPVVDHWWATEFAWPVLCTPLEKGTHKPLVPIRPGSAGVPVPGWDIRVLRPEEATVGSQHEFFEIGGASASSDPALPPPISSPSHHAHHSSGHSSGPHELPQSIRKVMGHHSTLSPHPWLAEASEGQLGPLVLRLPLAPGALMKLFGGPEADVRYRKSYTDPFPGYFAAGDAAFIEHEYVHVMGRIDDVINVAGHRLSTGAIEAAIATHPSVAESACIGAYDLLKGQVPLALIVLKQNVVDANKVAAEAAELVRAQVGAVASLKVAVVVPRLPKTRSGKVLRATIRAIADGLPFKAPATIDDPTVLEEIAGVLKGVGYAKAASAASPSSSPSK